MSFSRLKRYPLLALMVIVVAFTAMTLLLRTTGRIESSLPIKSLHQERDFYAFLLDVTRLESALRLAAADTRPSQLEAAGMALDLMLLRLRDNRALYRDAPVAGLVELHDELQRQAADLDALLVSPGLTAAQLEPHIAVIGQARQDLQSINDRIFQASMAQVSGQKDALAELRWIMLAQVGLFVLFGLALVYMALRQQRTIQSLRQRESQLTESDASYRGLFNGVSQAIYIQDDHGRFIDVNDGAVRMYGYAREEFIGKLPDFLSADGMNDMAQLQADFMAVMQGESRQFEFWGRRKNGEVFPKQVWQSKGRYFGRDVVIAMSNDITLRKQAEDALKVSQERLDLALAGADLGLWDWHIPSGRVLFNARWATMLGYSLDEIEPNVATWQHLVNKNEQAMIDAALTAHFNGETEIYECEHRLRRSDDHWAWILAKGKVVEWSSEHQPIRMVGTHMDITERKRVADVLHEREKHLAILLSSMQDLVFVVDTAGGITEFHAPAGLAPCMPAERYLKKTYAETFPKEVATALDDAIVGVLTDGEPRHFEYALGLDDCEHHFLGTVTQLADSEEFPSGYLVVSRDISQRKLAEEEIRQLAFYDALTGLPNRRLLLDRLQHALAASLRNQREGALFFIDLDNFKALNDTLGHDFGDLLLIQVARRLLESVREGDTVARLGGDEFVVMLEDLSQDSQQAASQAEIVGEKILHALNRPYKLSGHEHHSTPSIGVTLFSDQHANLEEVMKRADLAMYQAKEAGRNTLRFFDRAMQSRVQARSALEAELRQGIRAGQFVLYYQPQVDAQGQVIGAEALLRWQHPLAELIGPNQFIPLAEETGLILPLGHWVLEQACRQLVLWAGPPETRELTLAVNVSARQFRHPDFVDQVLAILNFFGTDPHRLKLELTESLLLESMETTVEKMAELKSHGIGFALDDFGTGYSSLSYLKRLPLDQLKIDRSFVKDVLTDPNDAAIASTIIALGKSLGLPVIAEGVETPEQLAFLVGKGCQSFQGYLFGKPVPIEEFKPAGP